MIDPIGNDLGTVTAQPPVTRKSAAGEFTKIFYRELFRQAFTNQLPLPGQDVLLDKLAEDFARKNAGLLR
jgi:hypothetical protein